MHPRKDPRKVAVIVVLVVVLLVGSGIVFVSETKAAFAFYVVVSDSMSPTFRMGDLVFVQKVPFNDLQVGDAIVFMQPSSNGGCTSFTVLHRVVARTSQGLITQGDNPTTNPVPDEPGQFPSVTAGCVQGKAVYDIPYVGSLVTSIPLRADYLLLALCTLLVLFIGLRSRGRRPRADS